MTHRVLVTRSQPGADATARALTGLGYDAIVEPLLSIEPIDVAIPDFEALAFTSLNGVRQFRERCAWRKGPVWCVGARTAAEARAAGYGDVRSADGDVGDLTELIAKDLSSGMKLLHAGNEDSRGDLAGQLRAGGHDAVFLPIYRSRPAPGPGPQLATALQGNKTIDAVLIHSPRAGAVLADFVQQAPDRAPLRVVGISEQAVLKLSGLIEDVTFAASPNEAALLEKLGEVFLRG